MNRAAELLAGLCVIVMLLPGCGGKDGPGPQGGAPGGSSPPASKPSERPSGPTKLTKANVEKIRTGVNLTLADVKKLLGNPTTSMGNIHTWEDGSRRITVMLQIDPITMLQTVAKVESQNVE